MIIHKSERPTDRMQRTWSVPTVPIPAAVAAVPCAGMSKPDARKWNWPRSLSQSSRGWEGDQTWRESKRQPDCSSSRDCGGRSGTAVCACCATASTRSAHNAWERELYLHVAFCRLRFPKLNQVEPNLELVRHSPSPRRVTISSNCSRLVSVSLCEQAC